MNNASLVGIGYTQTLRPGKCVCVCVCVGAILLGLVGSKLLLTIFVTFLSRYEANSVCAGGREEHPCRWSQARPGAGVGCMRPLGHVCVLVFVSYPFNKCSLQGMGFPVRWIPVVEHCWSNLHLPLFVRFFVQCPVSHLANLVWSATCSLAPPFKGW